MATTYTFGTTSNPGYFTEAPDPLNPTAAPGRPAAGTVLLVKNAVTLADLPTITTGLYGYWAYTTVDVPSILVSGDGGATWVGPLIGVEALLAGANAGAQVAAAAASAADAAASAQGAVDAVQAHENADNPHPQYLRLRGTAVGAQLWGAAGSFPTSVDGVVDGDYLAFEG